jgi:uncharacterized protein (TIRG00374 family)
LPAVIGMRLIAFFDYFNDALRVLRKPSLFAGLLALTAGIWMLEAVATMFALAAVGVSVPVPAALLLMCALNLAFVVPITPGNIGTHQLVSVFMLSWLGVDEAQALAFSVASQGAVVMLTLGIGAAFAWREGMGIAALRGVQNESGALGSEEAAAAPGPGHRADSTGGVP